MIALEKSDIHAIVEQHVGAHQKALEKNLDLQFSGVNANINRVLEKVTVINGRVVATERQVRTLEDYRLNRMSDCPYKQDIDIFRKKLIEEVGIEAYITEAEERRERLETKRNRNLRLIIAIITIFLGGLTFLMNIYF